MKVRFNITTNFRGTTYHRGDEANLSKADTDLFLGTGSAGMPDIIILSKDNGAKVGKKRATAASDNDSI